MNRREFVKGTTAAVAAIAAGAVAVDTLSRKSVDGAGSDGPVLVSETFPPSIEAPPPTFLVAPLESGSPVFAGWMLKRVTPVMRGGFELHIQHETGRVARIAVNKRGPQAHGVAQTDLFDLMLVNGGHGAARTPEGAGRALIALAQAIETNERRLGVVSLPVLTYEQRNAKFGRGVIV